MHSIMYKRLLIFYLTVNDLRCSNLIRFFLFQGNTFCGCVNKNELSHYLRFTKVVSKQQYNIEYGHRGVDRLRKKLQKHTKKDFSESQYEINLHHYKKKTSRQITVCNNITRHSSKTLQFLKPAICTLYKLFYIHMFIK